MSDSASPSPRAVYRADVDAPRVEVVRHAPRIAVVQLIGEHDLSTKDAVLDGLARAAAQPCVLVDFSRCTFVDSSVIGVLVALRAADSCVMRLVVPASQRVARRTLEMTRMDAFFPLHDSFEQALLAAGGASDDLTCEAAP